MQFLVLLYADESTMPVPGTVDFERDMVGFAAFGEVASGAIVAGVALEQRSTARTVCHVGDSVEVVARTFAETDETLGGLYVLEAVSMEGALAMARHLPVAIYGTVEVRPLGQWFDRSTTMSGLSHGASPGPARYLATIHGPESTTVGAGAVNGADSPDNDPAAHQRFAHAATDLIIAGGALHPSPSAATIRVRDGALQISEGGFPATDTARALYIMGGTSEAVIEMATHIPVVAGGGVELRPVMELDS